jgi:hypothetical protein
MTYLKIYCTSYPMVLRVNYFSNFNDTLEHLNEIWIIYVYYNYVMIIFLESKKKGVGVV